MKTGLRWINKGSGFDKDTDVLYVQEDSEQNYPMKYIQKKIDL